MKYIIIRVLAILKSGIKVKYDFEGDKITDINSTNDLGEYRQKIKKQIAEDENISVDDISTVRLVYYEQDGRE